MSTPGSSPLARGLPILGHVDAARTRIIPARAGFTCRDSRVVPPLRDHPRSRGVYVPTSRISGVSPGSSPLARGLLRSDGVIWHGGGIIPARAGFTRLCLAPPRGDWDHPRSRGVYRTECASAATGTGSSPLARGLRADRSRSTSGARIIPARAGFTTAGEDDSRRRRDHPRSRGVYANWFRDTIGPIGSSPLARGLRRRRRRGRLELGIIPARAGFTASWSPSANPHWDHPRSRGVYGRLHCGETGAVGSSPLARGLHPLGAVENLIRRIIPARAGFTSGRGRVPGDLRDHPRSRGVYQTNIAGHEIAVGSSPLARGLLAGALGTGIIARIIPARAGFTWTGP